MQVLLSNLSGDELSGEGAGRWPIVAGVNRLAELTVELAGFAVYSQ